MYFLGVDSGGTNTDFLIADINGNEVAEYRGKASNYHQTGIKTFTQIIAQGISEVLSVGGKTLNDLKGAVLGLGAFGEITKDTQRIYNAIQSILTHIPYKLVNDVEVAWAGALGMQAGINVVSGTGSIAYGQSEDGLKGRCGGWGPEIGDEGSAFWIGERLIQTFSMQSDGREPKTALYKLVRKHFFLSSDFDIISIRMAMERSNVASLSRLCFDAANMGDPAARSIFEEAAIKLAELAQTLSLKLNFSPPVPVSGTGGVFAAKPYVTDAFASALNKRGLCYKAPIMNGVHGAVLMAIHNYGIHPPVIENSQKTRHCIQLTKELSK